MRMVRRIYRVALFLLVVGLVAGGGVKYYLSYEFIGRYAGKSISEMTGRRASAGRASGSFFSNLAVDSVEMKSAAGNSSSVSVGRITASYSLRKILFGNFIVKDINFSDLFLNIKRSAAGVFDFEDVIGNIDKYLSKAPKTKLPFQITVEKLSFSNMRINFFDESLERLNNTGLKINNFRLVPKAGLSIFAIEGDFQFALKDGKLSPAIKISGLINLLNRSFKLSLETNGFRLGNLDALIGFIMPKLKIRDGVLSSSTIFSYSGGQSEMSGKINVKGLHAEYAGLPFPIVADSINVLLSENTARLYETVAGIPGLSFKIDGACSNILSPCDFVYNFRTTLTSARFESILSPAKNLLQNPLLSTYYSTGNVDFAISLTGIGFDMKKFDVSSWVEFDRVMLVSRKVGIDLKNLCGKVTLTKNNVTFDKPITFELLGKPFELKGYVKNIVSPIFDISLKGKAADLSGIGQAAERAGAGIAARALGRASGTLDISARASGTAKKYYYSLNAGFKKITISDIGLLPDIEISGNLSVRNEQLALKNLSITAGDSSIAANFELFGFVKNPRLKLSAETRNLDISLLRPLIAFKDIGQFFGAADSRINLAGRLDSLSGSANIDARNVMYSRTVARGEKFALPVESITLSAKLSKNIIDGRIVASLLSGTASAEAIIDPFAAVPGFKVKAEAENLSIEKFLAANSQSGGTKTVGGNLAFHGDFKGVIPDFINGLSGTGSFDVAGARIFGDAFFGSVFSGVPEFNEMNFERARGSLSVAGGSLKLLDCLLKNSFVELEAAKTTIGLVDYALDSTIAFKTPQGFSGNVIAGGTIMKPDFRQNIGRMSTKVREIFEAEKLAAKASLKNGMNGLTNEAATAAKRQALEAGELVSQKIAAKKDAVEKEMIKGLSDSLIRFIR